MSATRRRRSRRWLWVTFFQEEKARRAEAAASFATAGLAAWAKWMSFFWLAEWTVMRRDSSSGIAFPSIQIGTTGTPEEVLRRGMMEQVSRTLDCVFL